MAQIQGHCDPRFESLRSLLQQNLDNGDEVGLSLAISIDGELVVDLWGGYMDEAKTRPWERDTVVNVWSTTKTVGSLAALMLVDRGVLDLDERVSKYWPEFGSNGKRDVKVRHILSHSSGVHEWDLPVKVEDIYDLDASCARLAEQEPRWTPGTASGYHYITHGHLISQLIRRTTGKTLKQFVAEEVARPLQADFSIGVVREAYTRVADIIPPAAMPELDSVKEPTGGPVFDASVANSTGWRDADVGASNGHGNGRAIARILSPIAIGGTVDGVEYLSSNTIDEIYQEQTFDTDHFIKLKLRFGTGYGLPDKDSFWDWMPVEGRVCGWGGWGGSLGIVDADRRMTIGYAMNKMQLDGLGSKCSKAYIAEIYKIVGAGSEWDNC